MQKILIGLVMIVMGAALFMFGLAVGGRSSREVMAAPSPIEVRPPSPEMVEMRACLNRQVDRSHPVVESVERHRLVGDVWTCFYDWQEGHQAALNTEHH